MSFIILLLFSVFFWVYVFLFNSKQYSDERFEVFNNCPYTSKNNNFQIKCEEVSSIILKKNISDKASDSYIRLVYNLIIKNHTKSVIKDWKIRLNVLDDVYLNNVLIGSAEIHHFVNKKDNLIKINFNNLLREKDLLGFTGRTYSDDFYILLNQGDYIDYLPNPVYREDKILPDNSSKFSLVCYCKIDDPDQDFIELNKFNNLTFTYKLGYVLFKSPVFYILLVFSLAWIISFLTTLLSSLRTITLLDTVHRYSEIVEQSISAFMGFIDAKDSGTTGHSMRVANYSKLIAEKLGFSKDDCRDVFYIALMHDCGKIGIPDSILKKPGKLTEEEKEIIKTHTTIGAKILQDFNSIPNIREGVLYHHEHYDGSGYPEGLKGDEIPLVARIICIADAFDVMTSNRCYKTKIDIIDAIKEIKENKGIQFDPIIAEVMIEILNEEYFID